jgi:23S rRNA (guanosine2251-2'-O)-methyltransferase
MEYKKQDNSVSYIYGFHSVMEALTNREVTGLVVSSEVRKELIKEANRQNIPIEKKLGKELDLFCNGGVHQGVIGLTKGYEYTLWTDITEMVEKSEKPPCLLFLDRIQDPRNLGAIARSSYLLGVDAIVIPYKKSASVTAGAVKSSAGAITHLPICRVVNVGNCIRELKKMNVFIYGTTMENSSSLLKTDFTSPVAIIIGSEGQGIRPSLLKSCDGLIQIPMIGSNIGSYNAACAATIVLYEIQRQRKNL